MKATQINILADRPDVPDGWIIFNAPRPIYGHKDWKGVHKEGVFYTAVDPSDSLAQMFIRENVLLCAVVCNYITETEMTEWARTMCAENDYDFNELDAAMIRQSYFGENASKEIELNA